MHAPVLLDRDGALLTRQVQLWNDKRTADIVRTLAHRSDYAGLRETAANPAATSWPAFKLKWIAEHDAEILDKADVCPDAERLCQFPVLP
jgi:xylulokinase